MNKYIQALYNMPQGMYFSDTAITKYIEWAERQDHEVSWFIDRMGGFGGSEVGALLRHRHGLFLAAAGSSFQSAEDIIAEKLLVKMPSPSTIQCRRGCKIEALIQRAFHLLTGAKTDDEGIAACVKHSHIKPMRGETDDCLFISDKRCLIDYKSSQHPYEELPFDYLAQVNHYGAIAKSNGIEFDRGLVVGIHGPEAVLQDLAKISANRDKDPQTFEFWAQMIADKKMPGISLQIYSANLNPKLMSLCEEAVTHYWNTHVTEGKIIDQGHTRDLNAEQYAHAELLTAQAGRLLAMQQVIEEKLEDMTIQANKLLNGVNVKKLKFLKESPINISSRAKLDVQSATEALLVKGVPEHQLTEPTENLNPQALKERLLELEPDCDLTKFYHRKTSTKLIRGQLKHHELDASLFETNPLNFATSRAKGKAEAFNEMVKEVTESLTN